MEATRPLSQGGKLRVERAETVGIIGMEREQIERSEIRRPQISSFVCMPADSEASQPFLLGCTASLNSDHNRVPSNLLPGSNEIVVVSSSTRLSPLCRCQWRQGRYTARQGAWPYSVPLVTLLTPRNQAECLCMRRR